MKRVLLPILSLLLLISCGNNESETYTTHDVLVKGYKTLSPTSTKEGCDTKFLFFSTEGSPTFITNEQHVVSLIDFSNATDTTYFLLKDDDKITIGDGTKVSPVYTVSVSASSNSYKKVSLLEGRYFVCAVSLDFNPLARSRYFLKYCTKYIDVKNRTSELILSPVFPCDYSRCGQIPWTNWEDTLTYSWKF